MYLDISNLASQAAKESFANYISFVRKDITLAPHHITLVEHLEAFDRREILNLAVMMPPGHGKSTIMSQLFPSWQMAKRKTAIVVAGYSKEAVFDSGRNCKMLVESQAYRYLFPWAKISDDNASNSKFALKNDSSYYIVGVDGSLTSKRFNTGIIDDPFKDYEAALNLNMQNAFYRWYDTVFKTRRLKNAGTLLGQTLWTERDPGLVLPGKEAGWVVLKMPAIDETGEKALWEDMFPLEFLLETKKNMSAVYWSAMYQQNPVPIEGNLIKKKYLDKTTTAIPDGPFVISVDLALKGNENSDFNVFQVWYRNGSTRQLVDQVRGRWEFDEQVEQFKALCKRYPKAHKKLIEDAANGPALISNCKEISGMEPIRPVKSKTIRLLECLHLFEAGNVILPETSWLEDYRAELLAFDGGKNDDMVDATSQYLKWSIDDKTPKFVSVA